MYLIEKRSNAITLFTFTFILIGFSLIPLFKTQFIPPLHEGHFIMHMTSLPGTSEREMLRVGDEISLKILIIK